MSECTAAKQARKVGRAFTRIRYSVPSFFLRSPAPSAPFRARRPIEAAFLVLRTTELAVTFFPLYSRIPCTQRTWKKTFHSSLVNSAFIYSARRTEKLANPSSPRFYQQATILLSAKAYYRSAPLAAPATKPSDTEFLSSRRLTARYFFNARSRHREMSACVGRRRKSVVSVIVNHTRIYSKR